MAAGRDVVLIHGAWSRGTQWAAARGAFEERGYTVHAPTLRHHDLPVQDGVSKIASLSLLDYVDDLAATVDGLNSPPLLIGHSLGGLLAQLVAARTRHVGVIAACPSPVGPAGINPTGLRITLGHLLQARPWAKAVAPMDWRIFRSAVAPTLPEEQAREIHADLVCESTRVLFWELAQPRLDRRKAAARNFDAISTPVLLIAGERDRMVRARHVRKLPKLFDNGRYVELQGCDHMVFWGDALPVTMHHIDRWINDNRLFAAA